MKFLNKVLINDSKAVVVDAGGWSHYSSGVFSNCGKILIMLSFWSESSMDLGK